MAGLLRTLAKGGLLPLMLLAAPQFTVGGAFHSPGAAASGETNAAEAMAGEFLNVRQTGSNTFRLRQVEFDKAKGTISIPARVRVRKDVVEYALVTEQGKAYESLLSTDARPMDIHTAALLLGQTQAGVTGDFNKPAAVPATHAVLVEVAWQTNGRPVRVPLSELVCLTAGRPEQDAPMMQTVRWLYNGSAIDHAGFAAQREGSIISLIRDPSALVNNPGADRDNDEIHFPNTRRLPPEGTPVTIVIRCLNKQPKP